MLFVIYLKVNVVALFEQSLRCDALRTEHISGRPPTTIYVYPRDYVNNVLYFFFNKPIPVSHGYVLKYVCLF